MNTLLITITQNKNLISSGILIVLILVARFFIIRSLRKSELNANIKRQWIVQANNTSVIFLFLSLLFVWGTELRSFAISIVAIAAAVVIATKELILCLLGGVLKAISRPFKIGDRIEIGNVNSIRGDVISHNLLTTSLYEIGPGKNLHQYTGRTTTIPNSLFLGNPIFNESKSAKYRLHTFTINRPINIDIEKCRKVLLECANDVCLHYAPKAKQYLTHIGEIEGLEAPSADPKVFLSLQHHDKVEFIVRIPVESLRTGKTEQEIINKFIIKIDDLEKNEST